MEEFRVKKYPHFDAPLTKAEAESLATSPKRVISHPFYPFIEWELKWSLFNKKNQPSDEKKRSIKYAARRDSCILAHYRQKLYEQYQLELRRLSLDNCVLAYRHIPIPGTRSGKCNIHFAAEAFELIRSLGDCYAIAVDIERFFENLDHNQIKRNWSRLLDQDNGSAKGVLPADHFAVFKAVTQYSYIERDDAYEALGFISQTRLANGKKRIKYIKFKRDIPIQICKPHEFREKLSALIKPNPSPWGVPQGSPISDLLANLYMIDFDAQLNTQVTSIGGKYFRYSDDILIVIPKREKGWEQILEVVASTLKNTAPRLKIKDKKTQIYSYSRTTDRSNQTAENIGPTKGAHGLEYLGFRYDGKRIFLRNSTHSGFRRRITRVSERMAKNHFLFNSNLGTRQLIDSFNYDVLYKKFGRVANIYFEEREYTSWTFWTYIQRSVKILGKMSSPILHQVNNYKSFARKCVVATLVDCAKRAGNP
ncbi:reverse transcriptase domain-containing protein [Acidicapsa dinghuensis]|uniref:Reverse transcriptase domain-containing protein n=1 Tax=Acidicapsa dinghuensis TaxID=2218256 RepID=A0ABW1EM77_9BACT|nr:reverse transcriptase domain-containing protein [Acidicapsa dinghuensis]